MAQHPALAPGRVAVVTGAASGIGLAAGTHLIAATPGISLGCEFYMPHWVLTEDVLEEKIPNRDGHVVVPDGPGLGITVSDSSVRANARILAER